MHNDSFSTYNPIICFTFYIGAIVFGMFFVHPVFLLCSGFLAMLYYVTIRGLRAFKVLLGVLPLFVLVSVINPLFNTLGPTVLFSIFGRPYTFEALLYGMAVAGMFVTIILWFASYSLVMTSDKFLYIFGKFAPSITLTLTMVLRLVPNFQKKATQVITARKSIGKGGIGETKREKVEDGIVILSALTTWALEGGIITADSMRCRGYGTGERSNFSIYRFVFKDALLMGILVLLGAIIIFCGFKGGMETTFTPEVSFPGVENIYFVLGATAYFIFLAIPTFLNIVEEMTWSILRSRI